MARLSQEGYVPNRALIAYAVRQTQYNRHHGRDAYPTEALTHIRVRPRIPLFHGYQSLTVRFAYYSLQRRDLQTSSQCLRRPTI